MTSCYMTVEICPKILVKTKVFSTVKLDLLASSYTLCMHNTKLLNNGNLPYYKLRRREAAQPVLRQLSKEVQTASAHTTSYSSSNNSNSN